MHDQGFTSQVMLNGDEGLTVSELVDRYKSSAV
jgi:hypothetical protein